MRSSRRRAQNLRLQWCILGTAVILVLLFLGLLYRQIIQGPEFQKKERRQQQRLVLKPGPRGYIYDRKGKILVANQAQFSAVLYLNELRPEFRARYRDLRNELLEQGIRFDSTALERRARVSVVQYYQQLAHESIGRPYKIEEEQSEAATTKLSRQVERHFSQSLMLPFYLAKRLTQQEYVQLIEHLPVQSPIQPYLTSYRTYPQGATASHILGYVSQTQPLRFAVLLPLKPFTDEQHNFSEGEQHNFSEGENLKATIDDTLKCINALLDRNFSLDLKALKRHLQLRPKQALPLIKGLSPQEQMHLSKFIDRQLPIQLHPEQVPYRPKEGTAYSLGPSIAIDKTKEALDLITFRAKGRSGRTGVELSFDASLSGKDGHELWVVDPAGIESELISSSPPTKGKDLYLSIDVDLQKKAEALLDGWIGTAIAIEPETGEILAFANKPDYDPNQLSPFIPHSIYDALVRRRALRNRGLQGLYPPASTFKILTAIAGMRSGVIGTHTESLCEGSYQIGKRLFHCHQRKGHSGPPVNLESSLQLSCNVFYYEWGLATGIDAISQEARRFGFGQPTEVELPYEAVNMVVPDASWKRKRGLGPWFGGDTANVSIGHGDLRVTPLQIAAFCASLARERTQTALSLQHNPVRNRQRQTKVGEPIGLSTEQYQSLINGMVGAVSAREDGRLVGTARLAYTDGLEIAGKTGTAEYFSDGHKLSLAWFMGFAPVEAPEVVVVVVVEGKVLDPNLTGGVQPINVTGGGTAAPMARSLLETFFSVENKKL